MKTTHILMLVALLLLGACKKDNTDEQPTTTPKTCQIITIKEGDEATTTYSYDNAGKVSKVTNLSGVDNGTFSYQSGSVIFTSSDDGSKETFSIDASGRITSDEYYTYKYNTEGYLIEKTLKSDKSPEFTLSYTAGNLTKVIIASFVGHETVNITYYDAEAYQNLLGFENPVYSGLLFNQHTFSSFKATFTGKSNKNLVKSITMERLSQGKVQKFQEDYVYKKDQDGKVTSITLTSTSPAGYNSGVNTTSINYLCK